MTDDQWLLASEAAADTIAACHLEESWVRQTGLFPAYADWLRDNARAAEKWLLRTAAQRAKKR